MCDVYICACVCTCVTCVYVCIFFFDLENGKLLMIKISLTSFSEKHLRLLYTKVKLRPTLLPEISLVSLAKTSGTH